MKKILKYFIAVITVMMMSDALRAQCTGTCAANAGADRTICLPGNTTLGGTSPKTANCGSSFPSSATYAWTPTTGLSSSTVANPVFTPTTTGTFTFTVVVTFGGTGCCCDGSTSGSCTNEPPNCTGATRSDAVVVTVNCNGCCFKNGKNECIDKKDEIIGLENSTPQKKEEELVAFKQE